MESELVPGLEGVRMSVEGAKVFAGAAKYWYDEAQRLKSERQIRRLTWFVVGALTTASAFLGTWWLH